MNLLNTMFDYRREASWAVWKTDSSGRLASDPTFPLEQAQEQAHGRAVLVSLNPGSDRDDENEHNTADWANFHSALTKHNDLFLARALVDTPYWGSYMVDLHPDVAKSDSGQVKSSREAVALAVQSLISQANRLGTVASIICVGEKSYRRVIRHAALIESETGISPHNIYRIPHYSYANSGVHKRNPEQYRRLVHEALGLN